MPEDGYGWEKLFSERMCRHYYEDFGLETRSGRYHNVYGPNGTWTGGREKAPAAISRKIAEAKLSGNHTIDVWGDGLQTRSFMYIDDCVYGTKALLNSDFRDPLNIGSAELISINGLVDLVAEIAGITVERVHDLSAPQGVRGRNSDNTLINEVLGWEPSTTLRDGMEKTYAWVYDQVVARAFQAVQVAMMAPRSDTTADLLAAAISAYLHEMLDDKRSGRIVSIESARLDLALGTHRHDTLNRFASLARAYLDSSTLSYEARNVWSIMFAGAINELVIHAVLSKGEPDIDTLAATASQIWRRG